MDGSDRIAFKQIGINPIFFEIFPGQSHMNVRGECSVWVRSGFYRTEFISAFCIGQHPPTKMPVFRFAVSSAV